MAVDDFKLSDITGNPFAAGAFGALVGLKSMPGATWWERFLHLMSGAVFAGFGTPALTEWLHMTSAAQMSFLAFAVGAFGVAIFNSVLEGVRATNWWAVVAAYASRNVEKVEVKK